MSTESDNKDNKPKKRRRAKQVLNAAERMVRDYMAGKGKFQDAGLMNDLEKIKDPKDRVTLMLKLTEFVLPKPQRVMTNNLGEEEGDQQIFIIAGQPVKFG